MKEITLKKDRVLEAASKCSTAKRTLEILCPEFFEQEKPKFEIGKWYKYSFYTTLICYQGDNMGYGFDCQGNWCNLGGSWSFKDEPEMWAPVDWQIVKEALMAEAKKRGFKEGVLFEGVCADKPYRVKGVIKYGWRENENLYFSDCDGLIYSDGMWAKIVPEVREMTKEQIEKELGYQIKIV